MFAKRRAAMPTPETALRGRSTPILPPAAEHYLFSRPLHGPYPEGFEIAIFGLGCFWGAERLFWQLGDGIWITAAGYAGGFTENPTYEEVCSGHSGHAEVVVVIYDPKVLPYERLLKTFWEAHDPTQGFRQGNDVGTQYRSAIYTTTPEQLAAAQASEKAYAKAIATKGYGPITTEIKGAGPVYLAEDYHQQYLAKVPHGYCGLAGTGVTCPAPSHA
ncbi:peptide methionine sulfoxide reductase [Hyphomicrobium denitrificans 1NES1]|uniref:Peptide methionine sulfoxide reductase MsrA n=1 Tax=Hyphomicrobium denitrificans 1NES1 TaxID=670307 RepID=N0B344_9HYPH|nr:peptide-methionine (S)-S-oxide reductase MsrA [Hyphomicrobium denitrificans]AGK56617.1 peptide methionine sulfoxide reductase [Hyphomicrobium denitrificans 1NES1]